MSSPAAVALVQRTGSLVSLPEIYWRARAALDDADASMRAVGEVIGHDPALTARLLRVANSAYFGLHRKVETVTRALTVLGFERVGELVLATTVSKAFANATDDAASNEAFWRRAVHTAMAARMLAMHCGVLDVERAFTQGLLHGIGQMVMYLGAPRVAHEATVLARRQGRPVALVEREQLGYDYAEVGALLAEQWQLPAATCAAIRWHLEPIRAGEHVMDASVIHLAHHVAGGCPVLGTTGSEPHSFEFALHVTRLTAELVHGIAPKAEQAMAEVRDLFMPAPQAA